MGVVFSYILVRAAHSAGAAGEMEMDDETQFLSRNCVMTADVGCISELTVAWEPDSWVSGP